MDERIELYKQINEHNLTPNEYFYLLLKINNLQDTIINSDLTKRMLIRNGWLDFEGKLSIKTLECSLFSNTIKSFPKENIANPYIDNVLAYRDIFPQGRLPSGKMGRVSIQELSKKFDWFFKNYDYTWNKIFEATKNYVEHFEKQGYKYMQNSSFFIYKQDESKVRSSALADWCENDKLIENEQSYDINI